MARDLGETRRQIEAQLKPLPAAHRLLDADAGVDRVVAAGIIAEVGVDVGVFATAQRLAAWAGVAPGNHESARLRRGGGDARGQRLPQGDAVAPAGAAVKTKGSYYRDKYHRLRTRSRRCRRSVGRGSQAARGRVSGI